MTDNTMIGPAVASDLVWRLLDDNAVVVSPGTGDVRVFNRVGTVIWQLLIDEKDPSAIEDFLVDHYEVTRERAHQDLYTFFDDLAARGVISWPHGTD